MMNFVRRTSAVLGGCVVGFSVAHASAQPLERHFGNGAACYARTYTASHLAKHSGQKTAFIQFAYLPGQFGPTAPGDLEFKVSVRFKYGPEVFTNTGLCFPKGAAYRCQIECDGGGFELKDQDADSILLINKSGFVLSECDGGDAFVELLPEPDDKVFRLDRMPVANCSP